MVPPKAKIRANPGLTPATRRGERPGSKPWIILALVGIAAGVTALVGFSPGLWSNRSSASVRESVAESLPTGTIAESDDVELCKRLRFDDDGRVLQDTVPCGQSSTRDARGQPVPAGTMRRLDAISKSFGGR